MYRCFGKLQVEAVKQVDKLFGMGCLDRRLTQLIGQVDGLVEDPNIGTGRSAPSDPSASASLRQVRAGKSLDASAPHHPEKHLHTTHLCAFDDPQERKIYEEAWIR